MGIPLEFISSNANDMEGKTQTLPMGLDLAVKCVKTAYELWRWNKDYQEIYSNANGAVQYGFGIVLNKLVGNNIAAIPLEVVARIAIISNCFAETIQEFTNTCYSWNSFLKAIKEHHLCTVKVNCRTMLSTHCKAMDIFIDPSTHRWFELQFQLLLMKVITISRYSLLLCCHVFNLSMCSIQLKEAIVFNPQTRNEAMNKIWLNWAKIFKETAENEDALLETLYRNKEATDHLLKKYCCLPCSSDDLIQSSKRAISIAKTGNNGSHKVVNVIIRGAKIVGSYFSFGLFNTVPDWLKEESNPTKKLVDRPPPVILKPMPLIKTRYFQTTHCIIRIQAKAQQKQRSY